MKSMFSIAFLIFATTVPASSHSQSSAAADPTSPPIILSLATMIGEVLFRPTFDASGAEPARVFGPSKLVLLAKILDAGSVKQGFRSGSSVYELRYHLASDTLSLLKSNGQEMESVGIVTATTISKDIYDLQDDQTDMTKTLLRSRPALFQHLLSDMQEAEDIEGPFKKYLFDKSESLAVRDSLLGSLVLVKSAFDDPCRRDAHSFLQNAQQKRGSGLGPGGIAIVSAFPTTDKRAFGFTVGSGNRNYGFVLFDRADTKRCKPSAVLISHF
jgi:hypothetical protein